MKTNQQQKAAKEFAARWEGKGYEKGESQIFWIELLEQVFGIQKPSEFLNFEQQVKLDHTAFIDAFIPSTHVMIEQKSIEKDLGEPVKQSDGRLMTPFQQAKRYASELPYSQRPRWIVTCNFREFWVYDMELPQGEPQKILLENLEKECYRLQFLVDSRSEQIRREEEISLKAGELVGKLYDALIKEYIEPDENSLRSLNILCVRLVFCLYAEDAGLFETRTSFEDYVKSFHPEDLRDGIIKLFKALDTPLAQRDKYDLKIKSFPYVNGGLFANIDVEIPNFTQAIVDVIVNHCAPFDWSAISPAIFGAVFESTLNPATRRKGGMHYTSIENIHKVIDPLFMDDLNAEFEVILNSRTSSSAKRQNLLAFQHKLGSLTFLDPACGSGNFLTETYLSLRRLENKAIAILNDGAKVLGFNEEFVKVGINQFYGIEINDFAVTVAKTALWIAECQMMEETERLIGQNLDFLPLKSHANIVEGNALRMDWSTLAEPSQLNAIYTDKLNIYKTEEYPADIMASESLASYGKPEVIREMDILAKKVQISSLPEVGKPQPVTYDYIMGNPPFVGYSFQSKGQKEDTLSVYVDYHGNPYKSAGKIDYVANWYYKASQLIQDKPTKCAFVSTNSITQGEQVAAVWKLLFERFGIHIDFAYRTFRWDSESEQKAHVHCVVIGFSSSKSEKPKRIFMADGQTVEAQNICPYLIDSENVWIENRSKPLCEVPMMTTGNRPADGGHLIIEANEYDCFVKKEPKAWKFIKKLVGSEEFINNLDRWCLWLVGATPAEMRSMPEVLKRVQLCKQDRLNGASDRQKLADTPYLFREIRNPENYVIVPATSSESRSYVPMGFLGYDTIPTNSVLIIPDAGLYEFGVLISVVHMAWLRIVGGRMKSDYRYSKDIVYNNFPWPNPTEKQKARIEQTAQAILDARAKYPDSSLADLYDERAMPAELRKAHHDNDRAVMQAYGFDSKMEENEMVAELFKLFQSLTKAN